MKPAYKVRDIENLEPHYSRHLDQMTKENLISKSDIAGELAYRDMRIEKLEKVLWGIYGDENIPLPPRVDEIMIELVEWEKNNA